MERKPTAHQTLCRFCHKDIKKGDLRFTVRNYGYHSQESMYAHPKCLVNWMEDEVIILRKNESKPSEQVNPSRRDEI